MATNQKPFYIALGVVVVGGIAFIASRMGRAKDVPIPVNVVVTAADTAGFRGYVAGSPTAPVEVTEYADFQCPHCGNFAQVQWPDLKVRLIASGKARWRFRDFPIEGPGSVTAAHAAACANDQGKYWPMEELLFGRQTEWALRPNPMPTITDIARAAGMDVAAWNACMTSAKYAGRIQASGNEATALGVKYTPSFVIEGRIYTGLSADDIVRMVDSITAAHAAPGAH